MKKIILYNPSVSSSNLGDTIISESAKRHIDVVIDNSFCIEVSTHLPLSYYYMRTIRDSDYKFVLGSNLLKSTLFGFKRQWDINLRMSKVIGPCILLGAGWWQYGNKPNLYTRVLLNSVLSKDYLHSVRDDYTKDVLAKMGITNVLNTACPTMWDLTPDLTEQIRSDRADSVVFTLTDYNKDYKNDIKLIKILISTYKKVFFWPQGYGDLDYLRSLIGNDLNYSSKITVLKPKLSELDNMMLQDDIEYVGTRLHCGIRALQHKKRSMIISIDNRAEEKHKSFNLPIMRREDINQLNIILNKDIRYFLELPFDDINRWKKQFE